MRRQAVTSWERYTASQFSGWELARGKKEENSIDKLCLGESRARPLALLLSHQGKLRQSETSLHLSVDGSSLRPRWPSANQAADEKSTSKVINSSYIGSKLGY